MTKLASALNTDLPTVAALLQARGRGRDRILAHITPEEARLLKERGGRGSRNPDTGLLEFDIDPGVENISITAPPSAPAIDVGALGYQPRQTQQPAPEQVTIAANAAPQTVSTPAVAPLTAPTIAAAPTIAGPASASPTVTTPPEAVTISGQSAGPAIGVPAPAIPTGGPAPDQEEPGLNQRAKSWLSNNSTLLTILGLGGLGFLGARGLGSNATEAAKLQGNLANIAAPIKAQGDAALATTLQGGLTPQNMQALQAVQAQVSQGQARGAVSSQQAAEAISNTFANLLNNQLNQALTLLNTADQYLQSAYINGYNANVANQTATTNFYSQLAQLAAKASGITA